MKNLIDIKDLSIVEIDELIETAKDIIENREKYAEKCKGKILGTLFFEPSTRTRLSFESAMLSLRRKCTSDFQRVVIHLLQRERV